MLFKVVLYFDTILIPKLFTVFKFQELYQWLLNEKHYERLLNIRSPYLEDFLNRGTSQHPETLVMFDLLWKYYEKTRNYAAAAKILAKLADRHSTEINLQQRIEYLSRAIICVKSGEICMESHRGGTGQLLHELEEKMEVARVQLQILEKMVHNVRDENAISQLNADLIGKCFKTVYFFKHRWRLTSHKFEMATKSILRIENERRGIELCVNNTFYQLM